MSLFPEREPKKPPLEEIPEGISPLVIEKKEVIRPTQTQFSQQVSDDQGKPLIQTPGTKEVVIELPAEPERLKKVSKGKISDSLTWFAAFWLRIFRKAKATHFNWKVENKNSNSVQN